MLRFCALCVVAVLCSAGAAQALPQLVEDENGDAALVFDILSQQRPLQAASATAGGAFGPLTELTPAVPGSFGGFSIAGDEQGGAVALWSATTQGPGFTYDAVTVSTKPPGERFGSPERISGPDHETGDAVLDVNARGDAIAAWIDFNEGGIRYAFRPAGGSFGAPAPVPGPTTHDLSVTLEADGGALIMGSSTPPVGGDTVKPYAIYRRPDGSFAEVSALSGGLSLGGSTAIAGNRRGDVLLAWPVKGAINIRERPAGGDFGPIRKIPAAGAGRYEKAAAVLNDAGDAVVIYGDQSLSALSRSGGVFAKPRRLDSRPYIASLAINEHGQAAIAWVALGHPGVLAAYRHAGARFGPVRQLSTPPSRIDRLQPPTVAIEGQGAATAIWEDASGEAVAVRSRRFTEAGPGKRGIVATLPSFVQEAPPENCTPPGAPVVARDSRAVIVQIEGSNYSGCLLARGRSVDLGRTYPYLIGDFSTPDPRAPAALAGPFAATVIEVSFHDGSRATGIAITDLRDEWSGQNRSAGALHGGADVAEVSALKLRRDGAAAWIACPPATKRASGRCARGGKRIKQVSAFGLSRRTPKIVGTGPGIDPASLEISGGRVKWRDGKRHRSATLG